jgi:hypothetical protein
LKSMMKKGIVHKDEHEVETFKIMFISWNLGMKPICLNLLLQYATWRITGIHINWDLKTSCSIMMCNLLLLSSPNEKLKIFVSYLKLKEIYLSLPWHNDMYSFVIAMDSILWNAFKLPRCRWDAGH